MVKKHAILSPSSASRWISCPGSAQAEYKLEDVSNIYSIEGNLAHDIASKILNAKSYMYLKDATDEKMKTAVTSYVEYVTSIAEDNSPLIIEQLVEMDSLSKECYGTADCIIFKDGALHVIDFKYGKSKVSVENNAQLILYAIGAIDTFGFLYKIDSIKIHIFQPNIKNIKSMTLSIVEIDSYRCRLLDSVEKALSPDAVRIPSKSACKFCKNKAFCEEFKQSDIVITKKTNYVTNFKNLDIDG